MFRAKKTSAQTILPVWGINALHTHTGGGLVYLNKLLPHLAKLAAGKARLVLYVHASAREKIQVPEGVRLVEIAISRKGGLLHLWEQVCLPLLCRKHAVKSLLCNANYVPFFAPKPVPIIHTNPAVRHYVKGVKWWVYWHGFILATRLSVWRAPKAFSVAQHIIPVYSAGIWRGLTNKISVANPASDAPILQEKTAKQKHTLLAIGDVYPQKNYPLMLHAFAHVLEQYPQAKLHIIGRPVNQAEQVKIDAIMAEKPLGESVIWHGAMPHEALMAHLQKATLYINTSLVECFNMPILEAMAAGTPVIVNDTPFQREVGGDAAIYVPYDAGKFQESTQNFATHISTLLASASERSTLEKAGLARAQGFTWQETAQRIWHGSAKVLRVEA